MVDPTSELGLKFCIQPKVLNQRRCISTIAMDDLGNIRKIAAKSLRKAKQWYLGYILCQGLILAFVIISIFYELNPNLIAVVTFIAVLLTESVRWRSEYWKFQGEWAKGRWELVDGLDVPINSKVVADWLADHSHGFLKNVKDQEMRGLDFTSTRPKGGKRLLENIQESAWWSKHESRRMAWFLGFVLILIIAGAFVALTLSIASLNAANVKQSGAMVQSIGGVICAVLMFIFSVNLIRLLAHYVSFALEADRVLIRCDELLSEPNISERDALLTLHDYQNARSAAPLLPTFIWRIHGKHLREQWANFRPGQDKNG